MQIREKTKYEIEAKASGMSDFLKMSYLEECLRQNFSFEIKRFCNLELVKLYEERGMFSEAAKKMMAVGEIAITFREKKEAYMKAVELYTKAGLYERAEFSLKKAQESGNAREREEMKTAVKILLGEQAQVYEKENRKAKALSAYEFLYKICSDSEKPRIRKRLSELYLDLGKMSEYRIIKGN